MNIRKIATLVGAAIAFCAIAATGQQVRAGTWKYSIDSFTDSTARTNSSGGVRVGGSEFEIYGLAIEDDGTNISVAINSNLPLGGKDDPWGVVRDGHTAWGDIFFNFSGHDLSTARSSKCPYKVTSYEL